MKPKKIYWLVYLIILLLFVTLIVTWRVSNRTNGVVGFISTLAGLSSFFVALLTAINLYIMTGQIDIANKQLEEMKLERTSRETPLIDIEAVCLEMEVPTMSFIPYNEEICFSSDSKLNLTLSNSTPFSAISVCVIAEIVICSMESVLDETVINSQSTTIDILYANTKKDNVEISFNFEDSLRVLAALRTDYTPSKMQKESISEIRIHTYYKSLTGGYFKAQKKMHLCYQYELRDKIERWYTDLSCAEDNNRDMLDRIKSTEKYSLEWLQYYRECKIDFSKNYIADTSLKMSCKDYPGSFDMDIISQEIYENELEPYKYPGYIQWLVDSR